MSNALIVFKNIMVMDYVSMLFYEKSSNNGLIIFVIWWTLSNRIRVENDIIIWFQLFQVMNLWRLMSASNDFYLSFLNCDVLHTCRLNKRIIIGEYSRVSIKLQWTFFRSICTIVSVFKVTWAIFILKKRSFEINKGVLYYTMAYSLCLTLRHTIL